MDNLPYARILLIQLVDLRVICVAQSENRAVAQQNVFIFVMLVKFLVYRKIEDDFFYDVYTASEYQAHILNQFFNRLAYQNISFSYVE